MRPTLKTLPLLLAACVVGSAQDPSWKSKPMKDWDPEDARQVLTDSPWAKSVAPQWVRDLSPDERRASGDMEADIGKGVGLEGIIGIFDSAREAEAIARAHAKPDPGTVVVRWESARPVRAAEQALADPGLPQWRAMHTTRLSCTISLLRSWWSREYSPLSKCRFRASSSFERSITAAGTRRSAVDLGDASW